MKYLLLCLLVLLTSCRYGTQFDSFKKLEDSKNVLILIQDENLNYENQNKLADYFVTSSNLISFINEDSRVSNYFHKKFFTYYAQDFCGKVLISKSLYKKIESKCTVSGFYICINEFRDFKKNIEIFYNSLTELEKSALQKNNECRLLMSDWEIYEN